MANKTQWREYWRTTETLPQDGDVCIVRSNGTSLRYGQYDADMGCFHVPNNSEKVIYNVDSWMPSPYNMPMAKANHDVPIENVYARLYKDYKAQGEQLRTLVKICRLMREYAIKGVKDKKVNDALRAIDLKNTSESGKMRETVAVLVNNLGKRAMFD